MGEWNIVSREFPTTSRAVGIPKFSKNSSLKISVLFDYKMFKQQPER